MPQHGFCSSLGPAEEEPLSPLVEISFPSCFDGLGFSKASTEFHESAPRGNGETQEAQNLGHGKRKGRDRNISKWGDGGQDARHDGMIG